MSVLEGIDVESIIENASYYRELLLKESILAFKNLNIPTQADYDGGGRDMPVHYLIMWSFFCDYDLKIFKQHEKTWGGHGPWNTDPVGVQTGQYHSFLLGETMNEWDLPTSIGPNRVVGNWHKDHYHYPNPTSIIAMNMHTFKCPPGNGDTVIVNLEDAYNDCPKHLLDYLQDRRYIYTDVCGCDDPPLSAEHPAITSHPVTKKISLCYPGRDGGGNLACVPSDGSIEQWQEYEDWMWDYINASENQFRMKWEEGDFLIWDNRSCIHNYFGGWETEERVFDRYNIGTEAPLRGSGI